MAETRITNEKVETKQRFKDVFSAAKNFFLQIEEKHKTDKKDSKHVKRI